MIDEKLQHQILGALYRAHYERGEAEDLNELAQRLVVDGQRVYESFGFLHNSGLADSRQSRKAHITPAGILFAEEKGLAPQELASHHADVRTRIIDALGRLSEEHGLHTLVFYERIIEQAKIDEAEFLSNYLVLQHADVMVPAGNAGFQMTHHGAQVLHDHRVRAERKAKFDILKTGVTITPQQRGHELERLLQEVALAEGWDCERNALGRNEEHDLVIHRDLQYFLTQCRWEKKPLQTKVVRDLIGRLMSRAGVHGLYISMSGFARGGSEEALLQLPNRLILLFGPKDVEAMFNGRSTFTDLMKSKMDAAIIKRDIVFE